MGAETVRSEPDDGAAEPEGTYEHLVFARQSFEFATDAQLRTDGHGLILEANHAAATLLRCRKEFLVGKPLGLFIAEGHRSRFYNALCRLWQSISPDSFESRLGRRGDSPRDVWATVVFDPQEAAGGRAVRLLWQLTDVTDRKRAEASRDDLLRRIVTAQEDERRRVSRELHDSVGQLLTALGLALKRVSEAFPAAAPLREVQDVVDDLARSVHDLAVQLRPTALDDIGLPAALAQLCSRWSARTGLEIDFVAAAGEGERLPAEVETTIYRLVQQALTNVARHAKARRVSVVVGRHGGAATVAVEDDGVGFDPETATGAGRLGIIGMRERAALVGGTVEIESGPGVGTTVLARFPLPERNNP